MIADNKENDDELIYFGKDRHFSEAQERLRNVQNAYYIAAASVRMLATTRELSDVLAWQDILTKGFTVEIDHQRLKDIAKAVSDFAVSQQKNNFQDYRHFAIVGICSALEYSLKCLFIDFAQSKKLRLERFADKSVNINAWEFVSLEREEDRLNLLADKLYQDASAKKSAFDKFKYYLSEIIGCSGSAWKEAIGKVDTDKFNEAFLVRNCIVHHGAKINSLLGKKSGFEIGSKIVIDKKLLEGYFSAIRLMGDSLSAAAAGLEDL